MTHEHPKFGFLIAHGSIPADSITLPSARNIDPDKGIKWEHAYLIQTGRLEQPELEGWTCSVREVNTYYKHEADKYLCPTVEAAELLALHEELSKLPEGDELNLYRACQPWDTLSLRNIKRIVNDRPSEEPEPEPDQGISAEHDSVFVTVK